MRKYLFLVVYVFLVSNNLLAAQGCLKGTQVYTNPPSGWNQWSNPIDDNCPSGASTSDTFAYVSNITSTNCSIGFFGWGGSGKLVDYSIMNCPIDDYIPLIIVFAGATGVYFLRRNQFAN